MSYSKKQVDDMLDLVEQEFEDAMSKMNKSEKTEEVIETEEIQEEVMTKSEESEEEDYTSIDELYSSMNKSEKTAHYEAAKKALYNDEVEEEEVMTKSEDSEEETPMAKSEIEKIIAENEELKKSSEATSALLEKLFAKKAPAGKAVTGLTVIKKSEGSVEKEEEINFSEMKKSEITKKLNSLDFNDLQKSDRNAINEYCLNNTSVDSIKHLITK